MPPESSCKQESEASLNMSSGSCVQFMASPQTRARYWARSFAGWHEFSRIQPNRAHDSLARLQSLGWIDSLITQVQHFPWSPFPGVFLRIGPSP